jgi:hypothetical protein
MGVIREAGHFAHRWMIADNGKQYYSHETP